jgi:hypothetical protein
MSSSAPSHSGRSHVLIQPTAATNGQTAKLLVDLFGNTIELTMPLAIGFVK